VNKYMTESDTLKMFCVVLALVVIALASMGCVENNAAQTTGSTRDIIYDGSQAAAAQATESQYTQDVGTSQDSGNHTRRQYNGTNATRQFNSSRTQQAEIEACAGKSAGDSCTLSFGSAGGPNPGFNETGAGSPPAGATGPTGMPGGNASQTGMRTPTGTCEASESNVLACKMTMPTGVPVGG
jgi:hypothetical protein